MRRQFPEVSGMILVGGASSRMGENKAFLPVAGVRLIDRVVAALRQITDDLILISNESAAYADLGMPVATDREQDRGPLMGLSSGLHAATHDLTILLACDMPFVNAALLRHMLTLAADNDIVIPRTGDGLHPLHAIYRRSTCLPAIDAALAAGVQKMIGFHGQVRVRELTQTEIEAFDPAGIALMNVNRPDELAAAERIAQRLGDQEQNPR